MTEKDKPRGHNFDGIEELDNDLPGWWVALFLLTIVFSVAYLAWYHTGIFPSLSLNEHYAQDLETTHAIAASQAKPVALAADDGGRPGAGGVAAGKEVFVATCAPCHGAAGQGVVGPNLTDDFWIHGATAQAVEQSITNGVLEKGMPAWAGILNPTQIQQVVAFLRSIQGTQPAGAKAPQGNPGKLQ